jgi:hypothetical protein
VDELLEMRPRVPDYVSPIVGWRVWFTFSKEGEATLRSPFHRAAWPAGEPLEAHCAVPRMFWRRHPRHEAPTFTCDCGIYASTWPSFCRDVGWGLPRHWQVLVLGTVRLWGTVVEAERGWRGELAYPEHLYVPADTRSVESAMRVANALVRYDVPVDVIVGDTAKDVLSALGQPPT